jgi:hypothetical protein
MAGIGCPPAAQRCTFSRELACLLTGAALFPFSSIFSSNSQSRLKA